MENVETIVMCGGRINGVIHERALYINRDQLINMLLKSIIKNKDIRNVKDTIELIIEQLEGI